MHPNHGGQRCPMVAMVHSLQHRCILQLANMLCNTMSLKLENIIVLLFISYLKAQRIVNMPSLCLLVADDGNLIGLIIEWGE
jgi:hypothetical protein